MKKFRWTFLYIAVVIALIVFTVLDSKHAQEAEQVAEAEKRVLAFEPAQVSEFTIVSKSEEKHLKKVGQVWQVFSPFQDSADQQAVATFLDSLATEKVQEVVKTGDELNLKTYGLESPLFTLKLTTDQGERVLKIGSVKSYDGSLYAQIGEDKKILLVSTAWDVYLSKPARELRDKRVYRGEPQAQATRVRLTSTLSGTPRQIDFERNDEGVWSAKGLGEHPMKDKAVDGYVEKVKALRAFDYMAIEKTNQAGLRSVGLEKLGYSILIWFEGRATPFELKFAQPAKTGDVQNLETLSSDLPLAVAVYRLAAQKVMVGPDEFYDPKAPFKFPVNQITQGKINAVSVTGLVKSTLQTPADSTKLTDLVAKVSKLEAVRFFDSKNSPPKAGMPSKLEFLDAKGAIVFELAWGKTMLEPAQGDRPEAVLLPVRTTKSKDAVAIPEASLKGLGLETL